MKRKGLPKKSNLPPQERQKSPEELKLVLYRLDKIEEKIDIIQSDSHDSLKFIKDNIFNPHTGLWTEVTQNTQFRGGATKSLWILFISTISLVGKVIYDALSM